VYNAVIKNQDFLNASQNSYDWLGHGIYFWESNLQRAYEFAEEQKNRGKIKDVAVIGAVIDLGIA
jgi:ribulose-5-phosphate 4-epimerase/fuculose-1-phosphate aldolase